ncbi:MAG: hypothetical protein AAF573_23260, partial [Bacteroidota bacterium]
MTQKGDIEDFIHEKLLEIAKVGEASVHYQNFIGQEELHFSITNTNVQTGQIHFENCTYTFEKKDCCTIIAMGQGGNFPLPNTPANPDLFFEGITYDGIDISMIEMVGSCTAGLIRNHYGYDKDHRLIKVQNEWHQPQLIKDALSSRYSYDLAGNIKTLSRNGWVPEIEDGIFTTIDKLSYTYAPGTSQLKEVADDAIAAAQPHGFGKNADTYTYDTYDANGNLTKVSGQGINNINYNLLNLPEIIDMTDGIITYEYCFSGEKIKKVGEDGERHYIGGVEYKGSAIGLIHVPNGRILEDGSVQYNLTDHLGNVVVMFEDKSGDGKIQ